jgi:hypothetical protein
VTCSRKGRIDHHAFHHAGGAVAAIERQIGILVADAIAEVRIAPAQVLNLFRVRVEQKLVRIKAMSVRRIIRPVHAIPIKQPGPSFGKVAMPNLIGMLRHGDFPELAPPGGIE